MGKGHNNKTRIFFDFLTVFTYFSLIFWPLALLHTDTLTKGMMLSLVWQKVNIEIHSLEIPAAKMTHYDK